MRVDVGTKTERGAVAKVLHTAQVLYDGWETDNEAWVVEFEDGTRAVLTTSHGALYVADRAEFENKLRETEESAASIRTLLGLIA